MRSVSILGTHFGNKIVIGLQISIYLSHLERQAGNECILTPKLEGSDLVS